MSTFLFSAFPTFSCKIFGILLFFRNFAIGSGRNPRQNNKNKKKLWQQQPATEGITNGVANVPAHAVLIQSNGGVLTIQGADDGTAVNVYSINGTQAGSAISNSGQAIVSSNLQPGSIAVVKIGEKTVKVVVR